MARLGKRERALLKEKQAKHAVDFSFSIETSTMRARYWENYSGKVCQNIKGSMPKYKASDCLFDKCQAIRA